MINRVYIKNLFKKDPQNYGEEYQRYLRSIDGRALLETYEKISKDTLLLQI